MFPRPTVVLIACQPKSGSTFLCQSLARLTGFEVVALVPDWGRREQELEDSIISRHRRRLGVRGVIGQNHVRNSAATEHLISRHDIRTVVLLRNLFDVVVSIRDHLRNESTLNPMAWLDDRHKTLPDDDLDYMIARLVMPWYMNFYMSWRGRPGTLFLTYEEMIADTAAALDRVSTSLGLGSHPHSLRSAAASDTNGKRFNVGVSGRGRTLSPKVRNAVAEIVSFYPEAADDPYIKSMATPQP